MVNCCVPFCNSHGKNVNCKGISYHEFPVEEETRAKWVKSIRRTKDWMPTDNSRVCSKHFSPDDYQKGLKIRRLGKSVVPTIFNFPDVIVENTEKRIRLRKLPKKRQLPKKNLKVIHTTNSQLTLHCYSATKIRANPNGTKSVEEKPIHPKETIMSAEILPAHRPPSLDRSPAMDPDTMIEDTVANNEEEVVMEEITPKPLECVQISANVEISNVQSEDEINLDEEYDAASYGGIVKGRPRMSTDTQRKKLKSYQSRVSYLNGIVKNLKETVKLQSERIASLQEEVSAWNLKTIEDDSKQNKLQAIFLTDQLTQYSSQKPRWSEETLKHCMRWRLQSPKSYEYCKDHILKLPSKATLQRFTGVNTEEVSIFYVVERCPEVEVMNSVVEEDDSFTSLPLE